MSITAIIIILLVIGIFVFLRWAYKYNNPFKLYFVMGKKGSGKTSFLCKLALKYIKKGWVVYTNVSDLRIPGVRIIDDISSLGDYVPVPNSLLLLDEVSLIWDNRHFKNFKDCTKEFYRLQRHYRCVCYLFSQTFDVDKKIRDLSDRMYLSTQFLGRWSLLREIDKQIVITEASPDAESRVSENLSFCGIFSWRFIYMPKYQIYFDSFVLPVHDELSYQAIPSDIILPLTAKQQTHQRIKRCAARLRKTCSIYLLNSLIWIFTIYYRYFYKGDNKKPIHEFKNLNEFWSHSK